MLFTDCQTLFTKAPSPWTRRKTMLLRIGLLTRALTAPSGGWVALDLSSKKKPTLLIDPETLSIPPQPLAALLNPPPSLRPPPPPPGGGPRWLPPTRSGRRKRPRSARTCWTATRSTPSSWRSAKSTVPRRLLFHLRWLLISPKDVVCLMMRTTRVWTPRLQICSATTMTTEPLCLLPRSARWLVSRLMRTGRPNNLPLCQTAKRNDRSLKKTLLVLLLLVCFLHLMY